MHNTGKMKLKDSIMSNSVDLQGVNMTTYGKNRGGFFNDSNLSI